MTVEGNSMFETVTTSPRFKAKFPLKLPSLNFRGGGCASVGIKLALLLAPLLFVRACLITYVAPHEIALRQISFGPNKGLQKSLVMPGYRRQLFGYETVRTFPRNLQVVEFTNSPEERGPKHRIMPAVNVPTVDGYPVALDITVIYRIADPF